MSTFVLVHGAWHASWCWEKVTPWLTQQGHTVLEVDLPGYGSEKAPASEVTLQKYVEKISSVIEQAKEPVILVGHSLGGLAISQAAEYISEKIESLVYVTAFLLKDGECMLDYIQKDQASVVSNSLVFSEDGSEVIVKEERLIDSFYAKCDTTDIERIKPLLAPQAANVFATKLRITDAKFGQIPRYYIECLQDQAITHRTQKKMYSLTPCQKVFTIDTDHSPFYSTYEELISALLAISRQPQLNIH